jgi:hypothetical protein
MTDREQLEAGIAAMLDGNRVRFGEIVADILTQKAHDAVTDIKVDMAQRVFNFDGDEEGEDPDEEGDPEDVIDGEEEEVEEGD